MIAQVADAIYGVAHHVLDRVASAGGRTGAVRVGRAVQMIVLRLLVAGRRRG